MRLGPLDGDGVSATALVVGDRGPSRAAGGCGVALGAVGHVVDKGHVGIVLRRHVHGRDGEGLVIGRRDLRRLLFVARERADGTFAGPLPQALAKGVLAGETAKGLLVVGVDGSDVDVGPLVALLLAIRAHIIHGGRQGKGLGLDPAHAGGI